MEHLVHFGGHRAMFVFAIRGRIEAPNTLDTDRTVDTGTQLETQPGACKLPSNHNKSRHLEMQTIKPEKRLCVYISIE